MSLTQGRNLPRQSDGDNMRAATATEPWYNWKTFADFFESAAKDYAPRLRSRAVERIVARTMLAWSGEGPDIFFSDDAVFLRHAKLYEMMTNDTCAWTPNNVFKKSLS